jgi:hypothetical protein
VCPRAVLDEPLAAQPHGFALSWTFVGTRHYLAAAPRFAAHRGLLLSLIDGAGEGRDALLGRLREWR